MDPLTALEGRNTPGPGEWWNESWYLDFANEDGTIGGYVRIGLYPNQQRAWCWVYVVTPEGTVVVRDHDVPLPRGDHLLARSEALWCELVAEVPMVHWAINVEAFGVRLDDPSDAYRGEIGERIAVGLELDWEALTPAYHYPYPEDYPSAHYQHAGKVNGVILLGTETIEFTGTGERDHSWGDRDWWIFGWNWASVFVDDTLALHTLLGEANLFTEGYVWRGGSDVERVIELDVAPTFDADGLPQAASVTVNGSIGYQMEALAHGPVLLEAPDGRTARFPRSLCRYTFTDGRIAHGWAEWLQVQRG